VLGQIDVAWLIHGEPETGFPALNECEGMMPTIEKENIRATVSIRVVETKSDRELRSFQPPQNETDDSAEWCGRLFEFAGNAPVTFAERFPRLMVCAVAIAFTTAAIAVEIEFLRGAGYYWQ
jgi:hypothetical protein